MIIGIFLIAALQIAGIGRANAQCSSDGHVENCLGKLKDGYTFLKSFKIDGQGGSKDKVEFSYVFSKDTRYFINICSEGADTGGIVVTMYDSNRKMVGTNFLNGKFFPGIEYPCAATGIYYITFTFQAPSAYCGGSVLGFSR